MLTRRQILKTITAAAAAQMLHGRPGPSSIPTQATTRPAVIVRGPGWIVAQQDRTTEPPWQHVGRLNMAGWDVCPDDPAGRWQLQNILARRTAGTIHVVYRFARRLDGGIVTIITPDGQAARIPLYEHADFNELEIARRPVVWTDHLLAGPHRAHDEMEEW